MLKNKNDKNQKKLQLDVETIRALDTAELDQVVGGNQVDAAAGIGLSISLSIGGNCCRCNA